MIKKETIKNFLKPTKIKIAFSFIFLCCYGFFFVIAPKDIKVKMGSLLEETSMKLGIFKGYKSDLFYTSPEHKEMLSIETAAITIQEEQKLHSMINETIEACFRYYETSEEKEIEKVKDLFAPAEYRKIKDDIDTTREKSKVWENYCKIPAKTPEIKFSEPRRYRNLENRIGIIISIPFAHPNFLGGGCVGEGFPHYIFIFDKINNNWKIEKMSSISIRIEWTEEGIVKKLLYLQSLGIEIVQLSSKDEQKIYSIVEKEYDEKILPEYKEKIGRIPKNLKIVKIKFEQSRKYRNLDERIGIISSIDETEPPGYVGGGKWEIFILKKIDNEWEIEKNIIMSRNLREDEQNLIQDLLKK